MPLRDDGQTMSLDLSSTNTGGWTSGTYVGIIILGNNAFKI